MQTNHVVPSFLLKQNSPISVERRQRFNKEVSLERVVIEHTFGMLKSRWQSLNGLRGLVLGQRTFDQILFWIRACMVLHNMLLEEGEDDFWQDVDMEEMRARWEAEAEADRDEGDEDDLAPGGGRGRRPQRNRRGQLESHFHAVQYRTAYE